MKPAYYYFGAAMISAFATGTLIAKDGIATPTQSDTCLRVEAIGRDLTELLLRYSEEHPSIIALRREIDRLLTVARAENPTVPEQQLCPNAVVPAKSNEREPKKPAAAPPTR